MALRCCQPVAARAAAWTGLALVLEFLDPCADGVDPAADLVTAGGRGLRPVAHVISMLWAQAVVTVGSGRGLAGLFRLARRRRILAGGRRVSLAASQNRVPV